MSDGLTPIIVFSNGSPTGSKIIFTALSNIVAPDVAYNFVSTNDDTIPSHYTNNGTGYDYSYVVPSPVPIPNIFGFVAAIYADSTINQMAQLGLGAWYPHMQMFMTQSVLLKAGWAAVKADPNNSSWITDPIIATVEGYATEFNIPLT